MIDLNALLTAPQATVENGVRTVYQVPIANPVQGAPDLNVRHILVSCLMSFQAPRGDGSSAKAGAANTLANLLELQDEFEPCERTLALLKEALDQNNPGFSVVGLGQVVNLLWPVVVE